MSRAPERGGARFAILKLDETALVLPQSEVRAIEAADDVVLQEPPAGGVGWIAVAEHRWPVYSLTRELVPSGQPARSRRMCALLGTGGQLFGLLCDEVEVTALDPSAITPLPDCMQLAGSPVTAIARRSGGIACVTTPLRLSRLVGLPAAAPAAARRAA
ncbi:MAG TPA: chemotaxis protein CheW [Burkholderiales bacterium]|nr:chemotaxis protein CheW [Burkholderiales bacterium]